jgi:glycosyltransferase involved in cell wall biosynthesis
MPMNVTIDVSPAVHQRAGLGRYVGELVKALQAVVGEELHLSTFFAEAQRARPEGTIKALPHYRSRLGYKPWRLAAMVSSYARVPFDGYYGKPQLVHATDHLLPHLRAASVFTLHDLIFEIYPEHHKRYNYTFLKLMMPRFLRGADRIIAVSQHTRADAVRLYGINEDKITVIYEGVDPRYQPGHDPRALATARARYNLPEQFILHVGTIEPRKNLASLLDAFAVLKSEFNGLKLVLVGKKGWLYDSFFQKLAASGLEGEVLFPGFVAEEDLPLVYQLATVFAFPSVYEGFGLPPLEAMACGVPVVCSNASSLPEVVGEGGLLIDPHDTTELTTALRRVLHDDSLRRELSSRGVEQAARFSWEKAARETLDVYRRCL